MTYEQKEMYEIAVAEHLKDASIAGYLTPEKREALRETLVCRVGEATYKNGLRLVGWSEGP